MTQGLGRAGSDLTSENDERDRILELRVYKLRADLREAFDHRFRSLILPMLESHGITVVAAGPSLHDSDSYCLLRAYPTESARQRALDTFYGSEEWLARHEVEVMAMIEHYNTVVLEALPAAIEALRAGIRTSVDRKRTVEK